MAVTDELARGEHGGHELGAIDDGVEPALQQTDQMLGGGAFEAPCLLVDSPELALANIGIVALQLLLGL